MLLHQRLKKAQRRHRRGGRHCRRETRRSAGRHGRSRARRRQTGRLGRRRRMRVGRETRRCRHRAWWSWRPPRTRRARRVATWRAGRAGRSRRALRRTAAHQLRHEHLHRRHVCGTRHAFGGGRRWNDGRRARRCLAAGLRRCRATHARLGRGRRVHHAGHAGRRARECRGRRSWCLVALLHALEKAQQVERADTRHVGAARLLRLRLGVEKSREARTALRHVVAWGQVIVHGCLGLRRLWCGRRRIATLAALLFAHLCLERFDAVDACLGGARRRPVVLQPRRRAVAPRPIRLLDAAPR